MPQDLTRFITPVLIVLAVLVAGGGAVAYKLQNRERHIAEAARQAADVTRQEQALAALIPAGFIRAQTSDGIAYGYRRTTPSACPDGPYCYGLEMVATRDCPYFLAAQIHFVGTRPGDVGTSRAAAKMTRAGRVVELLFPVDTAPDGAATVETVTCS